MTPSAVLVLGRARPSPIEVGDAVQALRAAGASVTVVTHDDVTPSGTPDVPVLVVGSRPQPGRGTGSPLVRLVRLAVRTALRRTPAANLTRAVLGRRDVRDLAAKADVVVAGDSHAIEAVWRLARRLPGPAAVNGVPAAVRELRTRRVES